MRTKKVNRYYCDFCNKSNCCAPAMHKHERRCTMNPNRECGMCQLMGDVPIDIAEAIKGMPSQEKFTEKIPCNYPGEREGYEDYTDWVEYGNACIQYIKTKTECPVCIMAVMRQGHIPIIATEWDYKSECEKLFKELRESTPEHY